MKFSRAISVGLAAGSCLLAGIQKPAAAAANLVPNPGFEHLDHGRPVPWAPMGSVFRISDEQPRHGRHCLRYDNDDPGRYVLCSAPIRLEPGRRYEFEAWIRTRNVRGKDSGAAICLEWADARHHYIGGSYPRGVKGTQPAWTRVHGITGRIPGNAAFCSVVCYVRKGMTGTAWWDDVAVRPWTPPLLGNLTTNRYRDETWGGEVLVRVALNLPTPGADPTAVEAKLVLTRPGGGRSQTFAPVKQTRDFLEFRLDSTPLAPGDWKLDCAARFSPNQPFQHAIGRLKRLAAAPKHRVFIDEHRRLIVNGKPFFPLGMYWSNIREKELRIYHDSPFNCIMPYGDKARRELDLAWKYGIHVIYSIKDYYAGSHWCPKSIHTRADERPAVEKTVRAFRNHPALLAWYLNDEMPVSDIERLSAHRRWVEQADPDHPTWVVVYQVDDINAYLPSFDAIGADPYPIPSRPISTALAWTRKTVRGSLGFRAVWMVPQVFDWAAYHPERKPRPPTFEEMRSMAWQCIAGGANGLIFYSWFDLWKMDRRTTAPGAPPPKEPFSRRWNEIKRMAAEIQGLFPVLLGIGPCLAPSRVQAPATVAWRVFGQGGATWLLVVNAAPAAASATFEFSRPLLPVTVRLGPGTAVHRAGTTLRVPLAPLGVVMLRIPNR